MKKTLVKHLKMKQKNTKVDFHKYYQNQFKCDGVYPRNNYLK